MPFSNVFATPCVCMRKDNVCVYLNESSPLDFLWQLGGGGAEQQVQILVPAIFFSVMINSFWISAPNVHPRVRQTQVGTIAQPAPELTAKPVATVQTVFSNRIITHLPWECCLLLYYNSPTCGHILGLKVRVNSSRTETDYWVCKACGFKLKHILSVTPLHDFPQIRTHLKKHSQLYRQDVNSFLCPWHR